MCQVSVIPTTMFFFELTWFHQFIFMKVGWDVQFWFESNVHYILLDMVTIYDIDWYSMRSSLIYRACWLETHPYWLYAPNFVLNNTVPRTTYMRPQTCNLDRQVRNWGWLSEDSFPEYLRKAEVWSKWLLSLAVGGWFPFISAVRRPFKLKSRDVTTTWTGHGDMGTWGDGDMGYCVHFCWWNLPMKFLLLRVSSMTVVAENVLSSYTSHLKDHSAQAQKCLILGRICCVCLQVHVMQLCLIVIENRSPTHCPFEPGDHWVLEIWHLPPQNEPRVKSGGLRERSLIYCANKNLTWRPKSRQIADLSRNPGIEVVSGRRFMKQSCHQSVGPLGSWESGLRW